MRALEALSTSPTLSPKALIFEEDQSIRAALVEGLKSAQFRVYEVNSLTSMESRVRGQYFELIIVGHVNDLYQAQGDDVSSTVMDHLQAWAEASGLLVCLHGQEELDVQPTQTQMTPLGLTYDHWKRLLDASGIKTDHYTVLARPRPLDLINQLERLAQDLLSQNEGASVPNELASAPSYERLVLWAGPKDHPIVRELRRACESLYHHLVCVESAQSALREARRLRFEVSFVHAELNDMAGLSLVRSLRREVGDCLPVAYVTSAQQVSDRLEGVHAGVSLYLNETAGVDALTQALRQLQTLGSNRTARILVIDDDEALVADLISEELTGGNFEVSCLTSPLRVLELLSEVQTDIVIIHADMQGLGGFELCRTLRALPEWQALPIILVTHQQDEALMVAAYKAGADDCLNLSLSAGVMRSCIEGRLERSRMVQDRADRDGLTGLLIRRAFNDALLGQMASARRRGSTVAVCLIDLDHFKSINDTYGHLAGDRVLSALGRLLSSSFRVEDLRGRWGGEEFVVAFSDESAESARAILERARREFVRFYFDGEHSERFQATFSAGIACYPQAGQTVEEVFRVADRRLYAAKEAGRNQIIDFDRDMIAEIEPMESAPMIEEEPITEVFSVFSDEALKKILERGPQSQADHHTDTPGAVQSLKPSASSQHSESLDDSVNTTSPSIEPEDSDADILPFFAKD